MITKRDVLIALSVLNNGNCQAIIDKSFKKLSVEEVESAISTIESSGCKAITCFDPEYPSHLLKCPKPPFVLYYRGNIGLIQDESKCVSVVGSKSIDNKDSVDTAELSSFLAERGYSIVSGLSYGVSATALNYANDKGKAVAVLANGICTKSLTPLKSLQGAIEENGLVISEYPPSCELSPGRIIERNRIIAALSGATIVPTCTNQTDSPDGSMVVVSFALNMNKKVGCFPHRAKESYCNTLIKNGALLIDYPEDALSLFSSEN